MAGFDPTHAVRFDLPHGSVVAGRGERHVLVPCATLDDLVLTAGTEAAMTVGRALGASIGERVAERAGGTTALRSAPLGDVVRDLAGELAVCGIGAASVERWGKALVVVVERPAFADLHFLASILEGLLDRARHAPGSAEGAPQVRCLSLGRDGSAVRFLVATEATVVKARQLLGAGMPWGDVLTRLQPQGGA
jgi:hypothetical protein